MNTVIKKRLISYRHSLLVGMLYIGLTVIMTWPIVGQLGTHIPFSDGDAWVHLWNFHWVKESLLNGQSPYFTDLLYFPNGISLYFHNIPWVNIAFWLPLQALIGETAAYSVVFMSIFAFNGLATYLMACELMNSKAAAFTAGLIVAFWPYTLSHHNHPNLIFIAWIPLSILYLKRFFEQKRKHDALLASIFITLIGLTRWQLLVIGGFLVGSFIINQIISNKSAHNIRFLFQLVAMGLLALLLMAPMLYPVVNAQVTRNDPNSLFVEGDLVQTDLLGYFIPNRYHPLWGDAAFRLYQNLDVPNKVFSHTIGYTVLFLAVLGLLLQWRKGRFWFLMAGLYIVLALGSVLTINGRQYMTPMPYNWVKDSFLIQIMRSPDRLNVVLSIPVAILAAYGVIILQQSRLKKKWAQALVAFIMVLILAEYIVAYPTLRLETPEWYSMLAQEPDQFGILEIPMAPRSNPDKAYMYYQLVHGKSLVGGHTSRPPAEAFNFINSVPMLNGFPDDKKPPSDLVNIGHQLQLLAKANIRYLILHKTFLGTRSLEKWREWLALEPTYESDSLIVYKTNWEVGSDLPFLETNIKGIGVIDSHVTPQSATQDGWIDVDVRWGSQKSFVEDYDVCFDFINLAGETKQTNCFPLSLTWPTQLWRENEIVDETYLIQMNPFLNTDQYKVMARLSSQASLSRSVELGFIEFSAIPRVFDEGGMLLSANLYANWENTIGLVGYNLSRTNSGTIDIDVHWLAQKRMDKSYVGFVHLIDSDTHELVSQIDAAPRNWSYPTYWWESGEIITDTLSLSLEGIDSDRYELWLGWYDESSGERLQINLERGMTFVINNNAIRLKVLDLP